MRKVFDDLENRGIHQRDHKDRTHELQALRGMSGGHRRLLRVPGGFAGAAAILFFLSALSACESRNTAGGPPAPSVRSATKERATGEPVALPRPDSEGSGTGSVLAGPEIYKGKDTA